MSKLLTLVAIIALTATPALSAFCDYRPSSLIGGTAAVSGAGSAGAAGAAGLIGKAKGLYVITNATTGATMLGSTAAGSSAAGTTGIIAGSGGVVGTVGGVIIQPWFWGPALVAVAATAVVEGGCWLTDE